MTSHASSPQSDASTHGTAGLRPDMRGMAAPPDPHVHQRIALLGSLGVELRPDDEFDQAARKLAHDVGAPRGLAMVNFIGENDQYFAGLYAPNSPMGRVMSREDGWCPHTVLREVPLPLPDVAAWSRFHSNRVADEFGIQAYLGSPLRGPDGTLGTICVIDTDTHDWGNTEVDTIKAASRDVVALIYRRAGIRLS